MTLFESLKLFPKVDLHIDFLGSIPKDTIYQLTKNSITREELDDIVEFDSLKDYDNSKELVSKLLNDYDNIEIAMQSLITKLKNDQIIYGEIFVNLELFMKNLDKEKIIKTLIKVLKDEQVNYNLVLEINMEIEKEDLYENLKILYTYYKKGINGIFLKKGKFEQLDSYQALFDKFIKDEIPYIVLCDSKITNQNKEIYYQAKRIIYNSMEYPDSIFLSELRDKDILLEFAITYQNYFHMYDDLAKHFIYDLYKENIKIVFTTCDMTTLDTDLLNEYCKLFNAFPFSIRDLVIITLNILNRINVSDDIKNQLIENFEEKANELL